MTNITVEMKSGEMKKFLYKGRAGGSFDKSIRYEGAFAIITDEWYNETAIPVQDIKEVKVERPQLRW